MTWYGLFAQLEAQRRDAPFEPTIWMTVGVVVFTVVGVLLLMWMYNTFSGRARAARHAADRAGLTYHNNDAKGVGKIRFASYGGAERMSISNQMSGRTPRGTPIVAYDFCGQYEYEIIHSNDGKRRRRRAKRSPVGGGSVMLALGVGRRTNTEWVSEGVVRTGALVEVGAWLPALTVTPEGNMSKLVTRITGSDIDFESEEFNRSFRIECADEDFPNLFLDARIIDLLLRGEGNLGLETFGSHVLVWGNLRPANEMPEIAMLAGLIGEAMPDLVRRRYPLPSAGEPEPFVPRAS